MSLAFILAGLGLLGACLILFAEWRDRRDRERATLERFARLTGRREVRDPTDQAGA